MHDFGCWTVSYVHMNADRDAAVAFSVEACVVLGIKSIVWCICVNKLKFHPSHKKNFFTAFLSSHNSSRQPDIFVFELMK